MELEFLRLHDRAKTLTAHEAQQTLPQIAIETLLRLLEITDDIKLSKRNKFLTRTLFLNYLLTTPHQPIQAIDQDQLFNIGLSCLYCVLQAGGELQDISTLLQFITGTLYGSYYLSEQHTQILAALNGINSLHTPLTSPYDFIEVYKGHIFLSNFDRIATYVIDLAISLPETTNASAEQIFVASCLFINDRSYNETMVNMIEGQFAQSIGSGFEMKIVLSQMFESLLEDQA